jgi:hypothetical protein
MWMTGGSHPSAAGGGCAHWWAERAALGRQELLGCDAAGDGGGLRTKLEAGLQFKRAAGQIKRERGRRAKERIFNFEKQSNNEFKQEFEFKHPKMMHQHVCNSKLLYLIIYLRKMVKCL